MFRGPRDALWWGLSPQVIGRYHLAVPSLVLEGAVACKIVGDVAVMVFDVPRWELRHADALFEETLALGPPAPHSLIQHLGSEPGAAVRRRLVELQRDLEARHPFEGQRKVAVITHSAMTRGAVTAWRWLSGNEGMVAWAPDDVEAAADWLTDSDGIAARKTIATYRACHDLLAPRRRLQAR